MNRGKHASRGYTIVEVVIFLAVTTALFISAAAVIGGQQARAEFQSAVKEFELQIGDIVNNVSTGYYPSLENIVCTVTGGDRPKIVTGAKDQGTNNECLYLGRAIQFAPDGDSENYVLYTVAGRRYAPSSTSQDVADLSQALPVVIYPPVGSPSPPNAPPDASETVKLTGGVTIGWVMYEVATSTDLDIGGFAVMSSFQPTGLGPDDISSGSSRAELIVPIPDPSYIPTSAPEIVTSGGKTKGQFAQAFNQLTVDNADINPADGVKVCLQSGGTKQRAIVSIGGGTSASLTTSVIIENEDC